MLITLFIYTDSPTFEEFLRMLAFDALKHNSGLRRLDDALASENWNGMVKNLRILLFLSISRTRCTEISLVEVK